ncbi:MAG: hypothetical protein K0R50_1317 [Eubacterium sp.]|jgi:hypothetical protein|nr:hypothetical protein [Eubacterium sp.]
MKILDEILKVDWHKFDTAYGNAKSENEYSNVAENLKQLFSGNKELAMKATHHLWCSLCHQHAFVSSAALPAYEFLFYGLQILDDDLKVEISDIFMGFAVCMSKESLLNSWQEQLRKNLERDKPYFRKLSTNTNEDIATFATSIVEEL